MRSRKSRSCRRDLDSGKRTGNGRLLAEQAVIGKEMGKKEFEMLRQAVKDALPPVSKYDSDSAIDEVRRVVRELRTQCPDLKLECVYTIVPEADPGAYEGSQVLVSNEELLSGLTEDERFRLGEFVKEKLEEAEARLRGISTEKRG